MKKLLAVLLFVPFFALASGKVSLSFVGARLPDVLRVVYADVLKSSFVVDDAVFKSDQLVSVELRGLSSSEIQARMSDLIAAHGFEVRKVGTAYVIGKPQPVEAETLAYIPLHRSAAWLAEVVGVAVKVGTLSGRQGGAGSNFSANSANSSSQSSVVPMVSAVHSAGADRGGDREALVYVGPPKEAANVRRLLAQLDTPSGQVVLKAVVFEVGLSDSEGSAISVAAKVLGGHLGVSVGSVVDGARLSVAGGGITAVLSALGKDDRFKVISRPQVRVKSGGAARFLVGNETPVEGGAMADRNGNPIKSIEYRPSGILLTAKPTIRAGGVDLDVVQEISSYSQTTTGVNSTPTLNKRVVDTSLTVQPGEVVIMAGLDQSSESTHRDVLPWFGWLVGQGHDSKRTELIVFIEAERI